MRRLLALFTAFSVIFFTFFSISYAATTTVTPSNAGDNQITGTSGDDAKWNRGGYGNFAAGRRGSATLLERTLIKFNLSSIPTNAFVTSATLRVTCTGQASSAVTETINAYKLLRTWDEGTGAAFDLDVDSSWNSSDYPTTWGTAGASNTATDRESTSAGSISVGNACANQNHTMTLATTTVGEWITSSATNYGLILIGDEAVNSSNKIFASRENATEASKPLLTVNYDLTPNTPTSLGSASLVAGSYLAITTPNFQFTQVDNDGADTVRYHIQADDSSNFGSPVVDYTSGLSAQGATSFTVGQATGSGLYTVGNFAQTLSDGTYYWRIRTSDGTSTSTYATANSGSIAFGVDTVAPTPASFSVDPQVQSTSAIHMTATTATDAGEGSVMYSFNENTGATGGSSSGWQSSPEFTDTGLNPCTTYSYSVSIKDGLGNTTSSGGFSAKTKCIGGGVPGGAGGAPISLPNTTTTPQPPQLLPSVNFPRQVPQSETLLYAAKIIVKDNVSPDIYLIEGTAKRLITDEYTLFASGYTFDDIVIDLQLARFSNGIPLEIKHATTDRVIRYTGSSDIYLLKNNIKYFIADHTAFVSLGVTTLHIENVSNQKQYRTGMPITSSAMFIR